MTRCDTMYHKHCYHIVQPMKQLEDKTRLLCDICKLTNRCDCRWTVNLVGHCKLCGSKDLLPMQGEKRNWYHLACLALNSFMVSETRLKFDSRFVTLEPVSKVSGQGEEALPCSICNRSEGLIYPCSFSSAKEFESQSTVEGTQTSKCNSRFHPLCAYFVV